MIGKLRAFALLIAIVTLSSTKPSAVHKYYTSITEIEYNQSESSLQIITRIFLDDLEKALSKSTGNTVVFSADNESEENIALLNAYLKKNLVITIDGKIFEPVYLGKRHENGQLYAYLEISNVTYIDEIVVENTVLMDVFEEQQNIVHTKINGSTVSNILTSANDHFKLNVSP